MLKEACVYYHNIEVLVKTADLKRQYKTKRNV